MNTSEIVLIIYGAASIWEIYLHISYRASYKIAQKIESSLRPEKQHYLLPTLFGTIWLARSSRAFLIYFVYQYYGLVIAIALFLAPFIIGIYMPYSEWYFSKKFKKVLSSRANIFIKNEDLSYMDLLIYRERLNYLYINIPENEVSSFLEKGDIDFWNRVAANPEYCFEFFEKSECWKVLFKSDPGPGSDYFGPVKLTVPSLDGETFFVYGKLSCFEKSLKELSVKLDSLPRAT